MNKILEKNSSHFFKTEYMKKKLPSFDRKVEEANEKEWLAFYTYMYMLQIYPINFRVNLSH